MFIKMQQFNSSARINSNSHTRCSMETIAMREAGWKYNGIEGAGRDQSSEL